jgi:hypothetical protein
MDDVVMSAGRLKAWLRDFGRAKSGQVWCDDLERVIEAAIATAEQGRRLQILSSCMDGIIGALADAKTVLCIRQDGDYAASVRELTRERDEQGRRAEWYGLVLRAGNRGIVWWRSRTRLGIGDDSEPYIEVDANGLPIETPELRAALEAALNKGVRDR